MEKALSDIRAASPSSPPPLPLWRISLWPLLVAAGSLGLTWFLGQGASPWEHWTPAPCLRASRCFCAGVGGGWVRQWANAYTSLAFVFVACGCWGWLRWTSAHPSAGSPTQARRAAASLFALSVFLWGWGSFVFHASLSQVGHWWEQLSTVAVMNSTLCLLLADRATPSSRYIWAQWSALMLLALLMMAFVGPWLQVCFFLAMLFGIWWSQRKPRRSLGIASAVLWLLGYGWTGLDQAKVICDPSSLWQGHAIGHLLYAAAVVCLFASLVVGESRLTA